MCAGPPTSSAGDSGMKREVDTGMATGPQQMPSLTTPTDGTSIPGIKMRKQQNIKSKISLLDVYYMEIVYNNEIYCSTPFIYISHFQVAITL